MGWLKVSRALAVIENELPAVMLPAGTEDEADEPDTTSAATDTGRHSLRLKFWQALLSRPKAKGTRHADITPGEYTQLTGRAGRRGIDVEGHAVVLWQRGMSPEHLAGLAGTRTYPLRSSFKPSYNMAVNLVEQFGRHRSRELLETSFAQFQADRSVVGISRQVQRNEEGLAGYQESMTCHLGDFDEYMRLRRELKDREAELSRQGAVQRRAAASDALEKLKAGDIIHVPAGKYAATSNTRPTSTASK